MADHLHPAIDIPGDGLWDGARIAHRDGDGVTVEDQRGCSSVLCVLYDEDGGARLALPPTERLSLRLDDPLGLGLAGLAARVAERMGWFVGASVESVSLALADQPWCSLEWEPGPARVREAATLLARLDRLAAAVDPTYTVRPGVVPEWDRVDPWPDAPEEVNPHAGWRLTIHEAGRQHPRVTIWHDDVLGLNTPDPLAALGAALEVCGG